MTNLIFDLNNIAYRSLFIISGYGSKMYTFENDVEIQQLIRKIAIDVSYIIRLINPSRVIFALDSKSWRKDINIDENEGYKGNRIKSKVINWNNVYSALDEFAELMQNYGMIVSKIENAEADDVITLWSHELQYKQNQHVIIVSGDEDIRQLVGCNNYDNNKYAFSVVYNPFMQGKNSSRKFYVSEQFNQWINTIDVVDLFNMRGSINVDKEDFKKIINAEKTKMEVVDGRMIALRKIFCGDDSDNVPAIYSWISKNKDGEEEKKRITNSKFEKIYEILSNTNQNFSYIDLKGKQVLEALKTTTKQNPTFNIDNRIDRQIKLVVLDRRVFPTEIVEMFDSIKEQEFNKSRTNYANLNMQNLLEGTRYVSDRKNENESPIFKQIDRIKGSALF